MIWDIDPLKGRSSKKMSDFIASIWWMQTHQLKNAMEPCGKSNLLWIQTFVWHRWTLPLSITIMDSPTKLTHLMWNELILDYVFGGLDGQPHSVMERPTETTPVAKMYLCEVCKRSFTRKNNLAKNLSVHGEKGFQCSHYPKCYRRREKLKSTYFVNTQIKMTRPKTHWPRHIVLSCLCSLSTLDVTTLCARKICWSNQAWYKKAMMLKITSAERRYPQDLEVGVLVSTLLCANEHLLEQFVSNKYKKALNLYQQSQVRHVPVFENAILKPWKSDIYTLIEQPNHREFIHVAGQQEGGGKTFLQIYIKFHYSYRHMITTNIATSTKDSAHYLSKFPLQCKDIFLFNHPCSTAKWLLMNCWMELRIGTSSVLSMTHNIYHSSHLTPRLSFPMHSQPQRLSRKPDGEPMKLYVKSCITKLHQILSPNRGFLRWILTKK